MAVDDKSVWSGGDEMVGRADALLGSHRLGRPQAPPPAAAVPTLTETVGNDANAAEIPTLTDIVAAIAEPVAAPAIAQAIAERLQTGISTRIANAIPPTPAAKHAGTTGPTLQKVSADLTADIDAMVRASLAERLASSCHRYNARPLQPYTHSPLQDGTRKKLRTAGD